MQMIATRFSIKVQIFLLLQLGSTVELIINLPFIDSVLGFFGMIPTILDILDQFQQLLITQLFNSMGITMLKKHDLHLHFRSALNCSEQGYLISIVDIGAS